MSKKPEANPLFGKNIPPPPSPAAGTENGKTVSEENDRRGEPQTMPQAAAMITELGEERATIELSLYLRPAQDDKLEDLRRAYKRRTGKKISANEVMRRLIERATLDTLL